MDNQDLIEIVNWLLSVDLTAIPPDATPQVKLSSLPRSWQAFACAGAFAAIALSVMVFYKKEHLSPLRKILLTLCRIGALALAFLIVFQPELRFKRTREVDSVVLVLLDSSASMTIDKEEYPKGVADGIDTLLGTGARTWSRSRILDGIMSSPRIDLVRRLAADNDVKVYQFARRLKFVKEISRVRSGAGDDRQRAQGEVGEALRKVSRWLHPERSFQVGKIEPIGEATNLSEALADAIRQQGDAEIAAIVVLTDGRSNDGPPPATMARVAGKEKIPIYAVGIGDPGKEPKNLAILGIDAPGRVRKSDKDKFELRATLGQNGYDGKSIRVLFEKKKEPDSQWKPVGDGDGIKIVTFLDPRTATAAARMPVAMKEIPQEVGTYLYRVQVLDELPEDTNKLDNQATHIVKVIESKINVLVVAGSTLYEYRYVKNFLLREPNLGVSTWLQSATPSWPQQGNLPYPRLDFSYDTLKKYHVVILMDPNPEDFTETDLENLKKFVAEEGGGMIYVASETFSHEFLQRFEDLREILPVRLDAESGDAVGPSFHTIPWAFKATGEGLDHSITRIHAEREANAAFWAELPEFYWSFPGLKARTIARVLLTGVQRGLSDGDDTRLLAAFRYYGPGRVLFLATDSTYLWRAAHEEEFQRFWKNAYSFLADGKLLGGRKRAVVTTDGKEFLLGSEIRIAVKALGENYETPHPDQRIEVMLSHSAGFHRLLALERVVPGAAGSEKRWSRYVGTFTPNRTGLYRVTLKGFPAEEVVFRNGAIQVVPPLTELKTARADLATLREIGTLSGGSFIEPGRAGEVPGKFQPKRTEQGVPSPSYQLWSAPLTLILFGLLLSLEWWVRKRSNLP